MNKEDIINYVMETPGNSNPAVLGSMLNSYGGGGVLPTVTSEDNGDVLTVVNGEWNKAAPSGGSGGGIQWQTIFDDTLTFIKGQYDHTATVQKSLFDTPTFLRITIGSGLASIVLSQAMNNDVQAFVYGSVNIGGTSERCSVNVSSNASMNETLFNLGFQEYSADGNVDVAIKIEKMIV